MSARRVPRGRRAGGQATVEASHEQRFHLVVFSPHVVQCTWANLSSLTGTGARWRATTAVQSTAVEAVLLPLLPQVRLTARRVLSGREVVFPSYCVQGQWTGPSVSVQH